MNVVGDKQRKNGLCVDRRRGECWPIRSRSGGSALVVLALAMSLILADSVTQGAQVVVSWGNSEHTGHVNARGGTVYQEPRPVESAPGPVPRATLPSFKQVISGRGMTLALAMNGDMWIWGAPAPEEPKVLPRKVSASLLPPIPESITRIETSGLAFFALSSETGYIYSWSWHPHFRAFGELILGRTLAQPSQGNDTQFYFEAQHPAPVDLPTAFPITDFACNIDFCLAIDSQPGYFFQWTSEDPPDKIVLPSGSETHTVVSFAVGYLWYALILSNGDMVYIPPGLVSPRRDAPPNLIRADFESSSLRKWLLPQDYDTQDVEHTLKRDSILRFFGSPPLGLAAGSAHALYLLPLDRQNITHDGLRVAVLGWGSNNMSQIGNRTDSGPTWEPIFIPTFNLITSVSAILESSFALDSEGFIFVWGSSRRCIGFDSCPEIASGMFGPPSFSFIHPDPTLFPLPPGYTSAVTLPRHVVNPLSYEEVYGWSLNIIVDEMPTPPPSQPLPDNSFQSLASWGTQSATAINSGLSVQLAAAPGNARAFESPNAPFFGHQFASLPPNVTEIKQVVVHRNMTRVLATVTGRLGIPESRVFAWGLLEDDETIPGEPRMNLPPTVDPLVGPHPMKSASVPQDITNWLRESDSEIVSMSSSSRSLVVLHQDGSLYSYHQPDVETLPIAHNLSHSATGRVECGTTYCLLLDTSSGKVFSWTETLGNAEDFPTLGRTGAAAEALGEVDLPPGIVREIVAGVDFAVAVVSSNEAVYTWGSPLSPGNAQANRYGDASPMPIDTQQLSANKSEIHGNNIRGVAAGRAHVVAILGDDQLIVWGENRFGQVGPHPENLSLQPPRVLPSITSASSFFVTPAGTSATIIHQVSCVRDTSFALTNVGLFAWGFNGLVEQMFGPLAHPSILSSSYSQKTVAFLIPRTPNPQRLWSSSTAYSAFFTFAGPRLPDSSPPPPYSEFAASQRASSPILAYGIDHSNLFPFTTSPSQPVFMERTLVGEMPPDTVVQWVSVTPNARYYVTTEKTIYVSGALMYVPNIKDVPFYSPTVLHPSTPPETGSAVLTRPRLMFSYPLDMADNITDAQAFGEGLAVLLSNGSVNYFVASKPPSGNTLTLLSAYDALGPIGAQLLSVRGDSDLDVSLMSCDYWTCCFRSNNGTTWCWGSLGQPIDYGIPTNSPQPITSPQPSSEFQIPDASWFAIMSSHSGLVSYHTDEKIRFTPFGVDSLQPLGPPINITGALAGKQVRKMTSGVSFIAALTTTNDIFVSGFETSGFETFVDGILSPIGPGKLAGSNLGPMKLLASSSVEVVDIAISMYSLVWHTSDGSLWTVGLPIGDDAMASGMDWKPKVAWGSLYLTLWDTVPVRVPYDSSLHQIDRLFELRAYSELVRDVHLFGIPRIILMRQRAALPPPTPTPVLPPPITAPANPPTPVAPPQGQPPTSPPPPTPVAGCHGSPPAPNCTCSQSTATWRCVGTVRLSVPSTIENHVVIEGDLIVENEDVSITLTPEVIEGSFVDNSAKRSTPGRPVIDVSGCAQLEKPITLVVDSDEAVKSIPSEKGKTLNLIESGCYQRKNPADQVKLDQRKRKCRQLSSQTSESQTSTGRASLTAAFNVTKDSCNHWWIILVCVVGCVLVCTPILLFVLYKAKPIRATVHPYEGTNM